MPELQSPQRLTTLPVPAPNAAGPVPAEGSGYLDFDAAFAQPYLTWDSLGTEITYSTGALLSAGDTEYTTIAADSLTATDNATNYIYWDEDSTSLSITTDMATAQAGTWLYTIAVADNVVVAGVAVSSTLASGLTSSGGGGGTPGGSSGQVQFNNSGAFGGIAHSEVDSGTGNLSLGADFRIATDTLFAVFSNDGGNIAFYPGEDGGEGGFTADTTDGGGTGSIQLVSGSGGIHVQSAGGIVVHDSASGINLSTSGTAPIFLDATNDSSGGTGPVTVVSAGGISLTDTSLSGTGLITLDALVQLKAFVFSALPVSPQTGMVAYITDSNTDIQGATIAGGGDDIVQAFYDGVNWVVTSGTSSGGGGSPAGASGTLQFNDSGDFGGVVGSSVDPDTGDVTLGAGFDVNSSFVRVILGDSDANGRILFQSDKDGGNHGITLDTSNYDGTGAVSLISAGGVSITDNSANGFQLNENGIGGISFFNVQGASGIGFFDNGTGGIAFDTTGGGDVGTGPINLTSVGGINLTENGSGGITLSVGDDDILTLFGTLAEIYFNGSGGIEIQDGSAHGIDINAIGPDIGSTGTGPINITSAGGVSITDNSANGIVFTESASDGFVTFNTIGILVNGLLECTGTIFADTGIATSGPIAANVVAFNAIGFAALPTDAAAGNMAYLNDSPTNQLGAPVVMGGGTFSVLVAYDGASWFVVTEKFTTPGSLTFDIETSAGLPTTLTFVSDLATTSFIVDSSPTTITMDGHDSLNASNKNLSAIDVASSSSLLYFDCSNNVLTALDVTVCSGLLFLNCTSNHITSLSFAGLSLLNCVTCGSNLLTALDLTGATNLDTLDCNSNSIATANLAPAGILTSLNIAANNLTSLDLSGLVLLETLVCDHNHIVTLDATPCTSMHALLCDRNSTITSLNVTGLTALANLQCDNNNLTTIDISTNTNLAYITCGGSNALTDTVVNSVLAALVATGLLNGYADISGNPAAPTGTGLTDKATLISRGWTVLTN